MDIKEFHYLVGETLMYCQLIEHDIKLIMAGMTSGDFDANYQTIKKMTLGMVVTELEIMDNSDGNPCLSGSDYKYLKEVAGERNYLAHTIYERFVYKENVMNSPEYFKQCNKLTTMNQKLCSLQKVVQKVRLDILKQYNRI